jgi:hypothetical protein
VTPIWRYAGRASDIDSTDCGDVPNIREVEGLPAILAGHGTEVHCRARWDCSWTYLRRLGWSSQVEPFEQRG